MKRKGLERLESEIRDRIREPMWPTDEQRADWAYGNTVIENSSVTLEMAQRAVREISARRRG
jgi:hypothetical protein